MRLSAIFGITLALALLVASLGYWGYQFSGLSGSPSNDGGNLLRKVNEEVRVQFVFLHVKEKTLDLLYLVSYDPISGRLSAIHLPTQGKVMSPAYGEILSFRELFKRFSNDEFRRELETVLNIDISFWLKSVEGDLRHLVDSVGGLTIEFPVRAASDSASSKTNARWLDGPQVKNYVNNAYKQFRTQGRRFRHKTVFLGLRDRIDSRRALFRHPRALETARKLFESNLSRSDWKTLFHLIAGLDPKEIKFPSSLRLVQTNKRTGTINPKPLKNMLPKPLKRMIREGKLQETIEVKVLNGAGIPNLAEVVRRKLQPDSRVDVVEIGNANRYNYQTTKIIDRNSKPKSAAYLQDLLGKGSIESNPSEKLLIDVTIIAGKDLKPLLNSTS